MKRVLPLIVAVALGVAVAPPALSAEDPFRVQVIESVGRTVTAELRDMDGDGREDLLQALTFGMPPDERRSFRVYLQRADGTIPQQADLEVPIPDTSAAYDLANVDGVPGVEVLLLRPRGIGIVSFRKDENQRLFAKFSEASIPQDLTMGLANDERGLDPLTLVTWDLGPEPVLVVPGLGETFLLTPAGELVARVHSGARANYFLEPPGLMLSESDIQIFLDSPRISIGDCNGDGRPDLLASMRHKLLVFYRAEDGSFPYEASKVIPLRRVSMSDHIRGSGAVRAAARDIDADGLADLILSETKGGVMDANSDTYIYFNRGGGWDLSKPDYAWETRGSFGTDMLAEVDGKPGLELMRIQVPITILGMIKIFLTEAISANLSVYGLERQQHAPASPIESDAWFEVTLGIDLDFDTSRPAGFVPTILFDLNGDGFKDYVSSTNGKRIEVFVGSRERGYKKRSARQSVPTEGQLRGGDLNGDGLTDLVIFNTRRENEPIRLLINRGILPGTPQRLASHP